MGGAIEMVCLANSEKHGARCIAGVRLDTGGWLRPVSDDKGSGLLEPQYATRSGHYPEPLDVLRVELHHQRPKYHQPENWVISGDTWELVETELTDQVVLAINNALQHQGYVLEDARASIPKRDLKEIPVFRSLTLVSPADPEFYVREKQHGAVQPRTTFQFDNHEYDLPITDPEWRRRAEVERTLPSTDIVDEKDTILFTISLGEAHRQTKKCYKIVAAIFTMNSKNLLEF